MGNDPHFHMTAARANICFPYKPATFKLSKRNNHKVGLAERLLQLQTSVHLKYNLNQSAATIIASQWKNWLDQIFSHQ